MKYLILFAIRLYWLLPTRFKPCCLFKESCSHYVYRQLASQGLRPGWRAFRQRYRQCRPGMACYTTPDGKTWGIMADGSVVAGDLLREDRLPA
jgi:uncharacterized protein